MRKIVSLLLVVLLFVSLMPSFTFADDTFDVRITASNSLSVRDSVWGNKIGYLKRNFITTVYGTHYDSNNKLWYQISYNGQNGYIHAGYTTKSLRYNVRLTSDVSVRMNPSGTIIGNIQKNTIKTVYGQTVSSGGKLWLKIWYSNRYGYIEDSKSTAKLKYYVRIKTSMSVRDSAGGNKIGTIAKNKIKTVYGQSRSSSGSLWLKIWFNGRYAYIYSPYTTDQLKYYVRAKYNLNVRKSPWGTKVGVINKNTVKTVYGQRYDNDGKMWLKVWYGGTYRYVYANSTTSNLKYLVRVISTTNVRTSPSGTVIGSLPKKTIKTVYSNRKDSNGDLWLKIYYDGSYAYIFSGNTTDKMEYLVSKNKFTKVRKTPGGDFLSNISNNYYYKIVGYKKDSSGNYWYKIKTRGKYGYVFSKSTVVGKYKYIRVLTKRILPKIEFPKYNDPNSDKGKYGNLVYTIAKGMILGEEKIYLPSSDKDFISRLYYGNQDAWKRLKSAVNQANLNNPFNIEMCSVTYTVYHQNQHKAYIKFDYLINDNNQRRNMQLQMMEKVDRIFDLYNINPSNPRTRDIYSINNYLINNSKYDHAVASNGIKKTTKRTAYGVLVEGSGVCGSYSKAFELVAKQANIKALVDTGNTKENGVVKPDGAHAWNVVKVDGKWYMLDATWNDSSFSADKTYDDNIQGVFNEYLLVPKEIYDNTRIASHEYDSTKFNNFYNYNVNISSNGYGYDYLNVSGKTITNVDTLNTLLSQYYSKGKFPDVIRINNLTDSQSVKNEIIEFINSVPNHNVTSYSYGYNEDAKTAIIYSINGLDAQRTTKGINELE